MIPGKVVWRSSRDHSAHLGPEAPSQMENPKWLLLEREFTLYFKRLDQNRSGIVALARLFTVNGHIQRQGSDC